MSSMSRRAAAGPKQTPGDLPRGPAPDELPPETPPAELPPERDPPPSPIPQELPPSPSPGEMPPGESPPSEIPQTTRAKDRTPQSDPDYWPAETDPRKHPLGRPTPIENEKGRPKDTGRSGA
jgi:protein TonB